MAGKKYTKPEMIRSLIVVIVALVVMIFAWNYMSKATVNGVINSVEVSGKYFSNKLIDELQKDFEDKENINFALKAVKEKLNTKAIDEVKNAKNAVTALERKNKELTKLLNDRKKETERMPKKIDNIERKIAKADIEEEKEAFEQEKLYLEKRLLSMQDEVEEIKITIPENEKKLRELKKELEIVEKRKKDAMNKYGISQENFDEISSHSLNNIAIWSKNEDPEYNDKIVNEYHTRSKLMTRKIGSKVITPKNLYGVELGKKVDKREVKNFFKLRIENEEIEENFDEISGYFVENISSVLENENREMIHALSKFTINEKDYLLDLQYSKRSVKETRIEQQIQKQTIILIAIFLAFLFVYSILLDRNLLMHVLVFYVLIFTLYPLTWVMSLTLKSNNSLGGTSLNPIPENPTLDNYKLALLNKKKLKVEGMILEKMEEGPNKARLLILEEINRNGTEFAVADQVLNGYKNNEASILSINAKGLEENYKKIYTYIMEAKQESDKIYSTYRNLEQKAKSEGQLIKGYDEFSEIRTSGKMIAGKYKSAYKYAKRIKKIVEKSQNEYSGNEADYLKILNAANNFSRTLKNSIERFNNLGKDYSLKITTNDVHTVYNVFDESNKNIFEKDSTKLYIEEEVEKRIYAGKDIEMITNKYYITFKSVPNENLAMDRQIYNIEYYTRQNVLFMSGIGNSLFVAILTSLLGMMLSSAGAYAFSRFRFPGREGFMMSFLVTQMFPNIMMLIPLYIIFGNLGLINTFKGLILAYSITALPFNIWNLKGFFDTVPKDLEEAALIDGCSASQTFYKIVLPLSLPSLAISGLFSFMGAWNEYIVAATFMNEETKYTIPVVIKMLVSSNSVDWPMFATMSVLVSIPVIIVFMMSQKYLVGGLTAGGVKG